MRALLVAASLPLAIIAAMPLARQIVPAPPLPGVAVRCFANDSWRGAPVLASVDREISLGTINAHPEIARLPHFTVEWTGTLVVRQSHLLRFTTTSDDGSWLWIGEQLIVDNAGVHAAQRASGDIFLRRGTYPFRVRYQQAGGDAFLEVGHWFRGAMVHPELLPRPISFTALRLLELWPLVLVALFYLAFLPLAVLTWRALALRSGMNLGKDMRDRGLLAVAALGLLISAAHIDYGVAEHAVFSADELLPIDVLAGAETAFRDWNLRWPPAQPAFDALVLSPFVAAHVLAGLPLVDVVTAPIMLVVLRLFSLFLLFATFALTFHITRTLADRRAALIAVLLVATSPVVVHFGPLANLEIPHLVWMTFSWWAWLFFWRRRDLPSAVLFGAVVGISLGVKDQAYAYYLAAPFAVLWMLWREHRDVRGVAGVARDARLWAIGVTTIVSFAVAQGVPWAGDRIVRHVVFITTDATTPYTMFDRTLDGYVQLARVTATAFVWAAGVPLVIAFVAGAIHEVMSHRGRRLAVIVLPILTYLATFLGVTMYVYDRFLIGAVPVLAFVGGQFLSRMMRQRALPAAVRYGLPALLLGVAGLNAVAQNVVFRRDARSEATTWIERNLPCGASVGVSYDTAYIPSTACFQTWPLRPRDLEHMTHWPDYFVFNTMYVSRFRTTEDGTRFLHQLANGRLGYRLVYRAESEVPRWAPLMWEARFRNKREDPETNLDKPINAIEVWKRQTD